MHALVVGANGLVGSRLVAKLLAAGHQVSAVARGPQRVAGAVQYHSIDLAQTAALHTAIVDARPDAVINCSAMTDVDGCEREPDKAYVANVEGVAALARASRATGAHFTHISTDYVFDGVVGNYAPDAVPNPRGLYAVTKHMGEEAVRTLCAKDAWSICRTAVVFGYPPAGQKNFGSWLYDSLKAGQSVKLFEDQWVSASMALNVAAMVGEVATRKLPGIWHTCGATVVNRVEFGHKLCAKFGFEVSLVQPSRMVDVKLLSPRPARSGLDVSKTTEQLNAKPWSLDEALEQFAVEVKGRK